jgi:cytochrome c oxidase cbb3-type subunit 2
MRARAHGLFATAAAVALLCSCHRAGDGEAERPGLIPAALVPSTTLPPSPALVALGRTTYEKECLACHGRDGNGEGEAAYLLYPRPRDFTSGQFRLVSTWESVPSDGLFRSISRGMPGSAMPSWSHLPERTRWGLVHYVKSFSKRPLAIQSSREPDADGNGGAGAVSVPMEPPYTKEAEARARATFAKSCAPCHGPTGKGDGQQRQTDSKGFATRPGLTSGSRAARSASVLLSWPAARSPMPQSAYLTDRPGTWSTS